MAHLSINELTTYRWSFEEDVAEYKAAGAQAIGVWRQKLSDFGEEKGIELLDESGLEVSNLLWAGGFTGSDGRSFRESVEDASDAIGLASAMDCRCLVVYSGARGGHTRNHARRLLSSALTELATLAADGGVVLAIEPMHPACAAEWTFLTTLDETLDLINEIDSPHVKLAFDTYHLAQNGLALERLGEIVNRIGIVHVGDSKVEPGLEQNRCALGDGHIPLQQIVHRLIDAGYDGHFDIELIGEEIEAADYGDLVRKSLETGHRLLGTTG